MLEPKFVTSHHSFLVKVAFFTSLDVTSLITNVPLNRKADFVLDCVYNENLVNKNLKKRTLKNVIKDTFSNTVFMANKKLYQQIYGIKFYNGWGVSGGGMGVGSGGRGLLRVSRKRRVIYKPLLNLQSVGMWLEMLI